jgi:hypothetical protein
MKHHILKAIFLVFLPLFLFSVNLEYRDRILDTNVTKQKILPICFGDFENLYFDGKLRSYGSSGV